MSEEDPIIYGADFRQQPDGLWEIYVFKRSQGSYAFSRWEREEYVHTRNIPTKEEALRLAGDIQKSLNR